MFTAEKVNKNLPTQVLCMLIFNIGPNHLLPLLSRIKIIKRLYLQNKKHRGQKNFGAWFIKGDSSTEIIQAIYFHELSNNIYLKYVEADDQAHSHSLHTPIKQAIYYIELAYANVLYIQHISKWYHLQYIILLLSQKS